MWKDTGVYNAIITACERNGNFQKALHYLHVMVKLYYTGNDNNVAVTNVKNDKKWGKRKFAKPDSRTFSAAIAACGNAGEWEKALGLFNLMVEIGVARDTVVYNTIIAALQNAGQFSQAKDLNDVYQNRTSNKGDLGLYGGNASCAQDGAGERGGATLRVVAGAKIDNASFPSGTTPHYTKDVYIQGLSEGMLRIFSVSNEDEERSEATGRRGARTDRGKEDEGRLEKYESRVEVFRLKTQRKYCFGGKMW